MSAKLIKDLKALLAQFDESPATEIHELFVDGEICPAGLLPCDPSKEECPDEFMNPIIYNNVGARCYTKLAIEHMPPRSEKQQVHDIHELEKYATEMQTLLEGVKKIKESENEGIEVVEPPQKLIEVIDVEGDEENRIKLEDDEEKKENKNEENRIKLEEKKEKKTPAVTFATSTSTFAAPVEKKNEDAESKEERSKDVEIKKEK